jgi:tetratricopeptide (TPR) repeat protein
MRNPFCGLLVPCQLSFPKRLARCGRAGPGAHRCDTWPRLFGTALATAWLLGAGLLRAQQPCPSFAVVVNTPEDELMLAINGAENPQEQLAALDKFSQEHADSKFLPCVYEYYTTTYFKLNNYDKAIEYGEKDLAANYQDLNLILNLMRAYIASGKVSDSIMDAALKVPDLVKTEINPARPSKATDADWEKIQAEAAEAANNSRAFAVYAFFQLAPRVTDPSKRIEWLDKFGKVYPEAESKYAGQVDNAYFMAYLQGGKLDKAAEYGEKAIAADPNNVEAQNWLAYLYAVVNHANLDKAEGYAKKALDLAQAMKKPEGISDDVFKREVNNQAGMAHLTLGYIAFLRSSKTKKLAPAIDEFKTAIDLLGADPVHLGEATYFLGYAYEAGFPANHHGAIEALTKSAELPSRFQNEAKDLLDKVKKAAKE